MTSMLANMTFSTMLLCLLAFVGSAHTAVSQVENLSKIQETLTATSVMQESKPAPTLLGSSADQPSEISFPHFQDITRVPRFHSTVLIQPSPSTSIKDHEDSSKILPSKTSDLDSSKTLSKEASEIEPILEAATLASVTVEPKFSKVADLSSLKTSGTLTVSCDKISQCQTATPSSSGIIPNSLEIPPTTTANIISTHLSMQSTLTVSLSSSSFNVVVKSAQASFEGSSQIQSTTSTISPTATKASAPHSAPVTPDEGLSVFDIVNPATKPSGTGASKKGKQEDEGMSPGAKTAIGILVTLLIAGLVIGGVVLYRRYNFTHRSLKSFLTSGVRYKTYNNAIYKDDEGMLIMPDRR